MTDYIISERIKVVDQASPAKVAAYIKSGAASAKGINYQIIRIGKIIEGI